MLEITFAKQPGKLKRSLVSMLQSRCEPGFKQTGAKLKASWLKMAVSLKKVGSERVNVLVLHLHHSRRKKV